MEKQYKLNWPHTAETKLLAIQFSYDFARYSGAIAALTMGNHFMILPVLPTSKTTGLKSVYNSNLDCRFGMVRIFLDRVYFTGTCRTGQSPNQNSYHACVYMTRMLADLSGFVAVKNWTFNRDTINNIVDISFIYT